jgi:hypothetical protein
MSMQRPEETFLRAGMDATEAADLRASGIVGVDLAAVSEEERFVIVRSDPVNVFAPTMNLDEYVPVGDGISSSLVLVDTHTGSVFSPARLRPCALLGREGFRQPLAVSAEPIAWGRARFRAVPYFLCENLTEYDSLTTSLRGSDSRVFFRGQTNDYPIWRTASVRRFLYGDDDVREVSLPSNAFRNEFDYAASEAIVQALFDDIVFRLTGTAARTHWVEDAIDMVYTSGGGTGARQSATTMALAQHYGVPTYGLDVTRSARFGWWFATHAFDSRTGKYSSHTVPKDAPLHSRPVVYVFRSWHSVELGDLGLIATRPDAQAGVFLHGSWGMHGNICAEDLIAVVVLGHDVGVCVEPLKTLFPGPTDDPVYGELLDLKASSNEDPVRTILDYVYEVHNG